MHVIIEHNSLITFYIVVLVKAFEENAGELTDLIEGDYPDEHIDDLQVGTRIPLIEVRPRQFLVGGRTESQNVVIGEYLIKDRIDDETQIGVPFVRLTLTRIS